MSDKNDLNQDGKLDHQDIAMLRQLILDNPSTLAYLSDTEKALLDINDDGQLTYDDVISLYEKIATLPKSDKSHSDKLAHLRNKLNQH